MLRLRMTAGRMSKEKMAFIADVLVRYPVPRVHLTTCQTVQLHDLDQDTVCDVMEEALDHGIVTMGGGGDFPRNVTCSPLSGVEKGEYFDVLPWAEAAGCLSHELHQGREDAPQAEGGLLQFSLPMSPTPPIGTWALRPGRMAALTCTVPAVWATIPASV